MRPSDHEALRRLLADYQESYQHLLNYQQTGVQWMQKCRSLFRVLRTRSGNFLKLTRVMAETLADLREWNADLMLRRYDQLEEYDQVLYHMAKISTLLNDLEGEVFLLAKTSAQDAQRDEVLIKGVSVQLTDLEGLADRLIKIRQIEKGLKFLLNEPVDLEDTNVEV